MGGDSEENARFCSIADWRSGARWRVGFRRCEVTRRAAFVAASGRVRADGRSSRPRNTLPAPDRRPRVSFVGRFGTEFAPRRQRLGRLFVSAAKRASSQATTMEAISLRPGGTGPTAGTFASFAMGSRPQVRARTRRALEIRASPPPRGRRRGARAPAQPLATAFRAFTGAPLAIDRQLTSSPRAGPLRVRVQAPELRGRDQVHQGIHRAVQRGASNAAAPPSGGRGQPSPRDRTHQGFGRSFHRPPVCLFCCRLFVFFRERRARRSRDASAPLRRAPFVFLSRRERRRLTRFVHHVRASYYIRTRRRDARRCPSSSRRPLWRL